MKTRALAHALVFVFVSLLTGCETLKETSFTGRLWGDNLLNDHYESAPNPNLKLLDAPSQNDVLVVYDEGRERDGVTRRRAYLLQANEARVRDGKAPRFVKLNAAAGLALIPSGTNTEAGVTAGAPIFAKVLSDGQSFTLYRDGKEPRTYRLPVYPDNSGKVVRILATPATVLMDGTVVAGVAGFVAVVALCESGATIKN